MISSGDTDIANRNSINDIYTGVSMASGNALRIV